MNNDTKGSQKTFTDQRFADLPLNPKVLEGLRRAGFDLMTPIQAQSLPLALKGTDIAGQGHTGTGKTAAFLIAAFHRLLENPPSEPSGDPRVLILAPTRELAIQIHRDAVMLSEGTGLRLGLAYGGIDYEKQRKQLEGGIDILMGTPGRVIDYFKKKVFSFNRIEVAVLDEADRMFDLGFIKDIRYVLRRMPPPTQRLNLLFSATLSYRVTELAYEHMNDPVRIEVEAETPTTDKVEQVIYYPSNSEKIALLIGLLRSIDPTRTMVFCNMKIATEKVRDYLVANGFEAEILSGDVRQNKRQTLLGRFHSGDLPILVATDVAARGLHIDDVSHVVNYDLPQDAEDYVHRIGRTARLGKKGDAVSFACEDYAFHLMDIEEYVGFKIPVGTVDGQLAEDLVHPAKRPRRRGPGGGKPGGRSRGRSQGRSSGPSHSDRKADAPPSDGKKKRRRRRRKSQSSNAESSGNS